MSRYEDKGLQTRRIAACIGAFVFSCLLSLSFINVAYAVSSELPAGSFEDGIESYNPPGYLFGLNTGIFNSDWTSGTSILAKQWSSASLGAAAGNVLLAVNADLNRMTNNYIYVINNSLTTIKSDIAYIRENTLKASSNTAGMLQELQQDSRFVTGNETDTHTIRYYIKLIKDYAYDIKQNMQDLKNNSAGIFTELMSETNSDYGDRHTLRYYIEYIYWELLNIKSSNSNHLTNIDTYAEQIRSYTRSLNSNVNAINTSLANNLPSIVSDVSAMRQNFDATVSSVNDSLLNVTTALGSGGYIGQKLNSIDSSLSSLSTSVSNIYTLLNSAFLDYTDSNNRQFKVLLAEPFNWNDYNVSKWTIDLRNGLNSLNNTLSNLNTSIDNIYTLLNETFLSYTDNANRKYRVLLAEPISWNDFNASQWTIDIRNSLNSLLTKLTNLYDLLNSALLTYTSGSDGSRTYKVLLTEPISWNDAGPSVWTQDIRRYVKAIYDLLNSAFLTKTYTNGQSYKVLIAEPFSYNDASPVQWTNDIRNLLTSVDDGTNLIGTHLETIIELIRNLDLTVNVNIPDNSDELIGDFDTEAFKTNSDLLIERVSQLAPFGAITVASAELGILTQVDPIQKPSMTIPFNFSDQDENVVLDLSWLDDAKPLFNFVMEFLFILMLLNVTMKYVRQEATS